MFVEEWVYDQPSFSTDHSKRGHRMTKLRAASATLFALLLSPVPAMSQAVSRSYSADFYVEGCKDFLAGNSSFFAGRCVGAVEVLDALNDDTKLFCSPAGATNLERVQVIVDYIEKRPDRKTLGLSPTRQWQRPGPAKNRLRGATPVKTGGHHDGFAFVPNQCRPVALKRRSVAEDEARRIAANVAKLLELLRRRWPR